MSFQDYIETKCKNCTKECKCQIINKIDGTIECVKDYDGLSNNK